jgi:hypothetical protein
VAEEAVENEHEERVKVEAEEHPAGKKARLHQRFHVQSAANRLEGVAEESQGNLVGWLGIIERPERGLRAMGTSQGSLNKWASTIMIISMRLERSGQSR